MTVPAPPSVQAPAPAAPVADAALLLEVPAPVAGAAPVIPPSGVQCERRSGSALIRR
ncbi:MAG TPA: hypothetical protein VFB53_09165 [Burkholderiales bacterium]|nr:hypothetical protein [Burkholderiales bacterium]